MSASIVATCRLCRKVRPPGKMRDRSDGKEWKGEQWYHSVAVKNSDGAVVRRAKRGRVSTTVIVIIHTENSDNEERTYHLNSLSDAFIMIDEVSYLTRTEVT